MPPIRTKRTNWTRDNGAYGSSLASDSFEASARRGKDASGSGMASGSSIEAKSRAAGAGVATPQCLWNVTCKLPKNEQKLRALAARNDPNDLYGKAAADGRCCDLVKGQIVVCVLDEKAGFRTCPTADTSVRCVGSTNGLSIANTRFFGVGVCQTKSSPNDTSTDQVTVSMHGVQTVVNYSDQRWNTGDTLVFDPFSPTVVRPNGDVAPVVYGPGGVPPEQLNLVLRPMNACHMQQHISATEDAVRLRFAHADNLKLFVKCKTSQQMMQHIYKVCDEVFAWQRVCSPSDPIRGYAAVWLAGRVYDMVQIDHASVLSAKGKANMYLNDPVAFANLLLLCLVTKVNVIIANEEKYLDASNSYATSLPHGGDHIDAMSTSERSRSSLRSVQLTGLLLDPTAVGKFNPMEAAARANMHHQYALSVMVHCVRSWFGALFAGVCLSPADKGRSGDIFTGKPV